jgi:RNA polymerase sigma factor (sigma-70 family)
VKVDETDAALPKNPPVIRRNDVLGPEASDFVAGVQSAWADCYRTEMPYLVRYLVKCFADTDIHDAYDAAHTAFAELLERWHTIRDPRAVRAWLRTVAFRQMLKQPAREYPVDTTVKHPFVPSAQVHLDLREQELAVIDALRQLPLAQRQVMALIYDGFSYSEIANITNSNEAAARKNAERARAKMKGVLGIN